MIPCISSVDIVSNTVATANAVTSGANINQVASANGIYGSKGNDPAKPAHLKQLKQTPQLVSSCPAPDAAGGGYRSQSSHQ